MDTVSTPTAAAEAKYCVGCGVDIHSKKIYERRLLCSEAGRNIKAIWEEIISMKLSQSGRELDLESFVGTLQNREYICRTCFDNYKKFLNLRNQLLEKAEEALLRVTIPSTSSSVPDPCSLLGTKRKRKRGTASQTGPPACKRPLFAPHATSPAVTVRTVNIYIITDTACL